MSRFSAAEVLLSVNKYWMEKMTENEFRNGAARKAAYTEKEMDVSENMRQGLAALYATNTTRPVSVCAEADKVIADRHAVYGSPVSNFSDICGLWNAAFGYKMAAPFTPADVAQAMRLVKEARLMNDPSHRDSLVDICGYAQCQNEVVNGAVGAAYAPSSEGISEVQYNCLCVGMKVTLKDRLGIWRLEGYSPEHGWEAKTTDGVKWWACYVRRGAIASILPILDEVV